MKRLIPMLFFLFAVSIFIVYFSQKNNDNNKEAKECLLIDNSKISDVSFFNIDYKDLIPVQTNVRDFTFGGNQVWVNEKIMFSYFTTDNYNWDYIGSPVSKPRIISFEDFTDSYYIYTIDDQNNFNYEEVAYVDGSWYRMMLKACPNKEVSNYSCTNTLEKITASPFGTELVEITNPSPEFLTDLFGVNGSNIVFNTDKSNIEYNTVSKTWEKTIKGFVSVTNLDSSVLYKSDSTCLAYKAERGTFVVKRDGMWDTFTIYILK